MSEAVDGGLKMLDITTIRQAAKSNSVASGIQLPATSLGILHIFPTPGEPGLLHRTIQLKTLSQSKARRALPVLFPFF